MELPSWLLPVIAALGGGAGLGAFINAMVGARSATFDQLQGVIKTLQDERTADREKQAADRLIDREEAAAQKANLEALNARVNGLQGLILLYSDWSETLLRWGRDGAPPPEPVRPAGLNTLL